MYEAFGRQKEEVPVAWDERKRDGIWAMQPLPHMLLFECCRVGNPAPPAAHLERAVTVHPESARVAVRALGEHG